MKRWLVSKVSGAGTRRHRAGMIAAVVAMAVVIQCSALLVIPFVHVGAAQATLTGTLSVIFADPTPGATLPVRDTRYFLREGNGAKTELLLDEGVARPFGGLPALIGEDIIATVNIPVGPRVVTDAPRTVSAIALASGAPARVKPRDVVTGSQQFANLLCRFSDVATEPEAPSYFQNLMQLGNGTVGTYWQQISYGNIDVTGSQTFPSAGPWYQLPSNEAAYLTNPTAAYKDRVMNEDKIASDCTKAATNAGINLAPYKGINFMLNDAIVKYSLGGQGTVTDPAGGQLLSSRGLTWLMPWAYHIVPPVSDGMGGMSGTSSGPGPMEHEMGHAFLLWHSGNNAGVEYKDSWDSMGNPYVNCDPFNLPAPYGCGGQSLTSYDKDFLGWIPANQKLAYTGVTRQITLTSLMGATTGNYLLVSIPHPTVANNFTYVEMRSRTGVDSILPGDGVIIHEIDTTNTAISKQVQSPNGGADAIRALGQAYTVPGTAVSVTVKSVNGNNAVVVISNGVDPSVTGADSLTGSGASGTLVTLTGTNFSPEAAVTFNGVPASQVVLNGNVTLGVTAPALAQGSYTVTVTNPDGRSATLAAQYVVRPTPAVQPPGVHPLATQPGVVMPQPVVHPTLAPMAPPVSTPLPQPVRH